MRGGGPLASPRSAARRDCARARALEVSASTDRGRAGCGWSVAGGERAALRHWSLGLQARAFAALRDWSRSRVDARMRRSGAVALWANHTMVKCMSRWRVFVALRLAESGVDGSCGAAAASAAAVFSSTSSHHSASPTHRYVPHKETAPTTAPSSTASTPRRSGISRRSLTAYRVCPGYSPACSGSGAFTEFQASSRASASADAAAGNTAEALFFASALPDSTERSARASYPMRASAAQQLLPVTSSRVLRLGASPRPEERVHHFIHIRRSA